MDATTRTGPAYRIETERLLLRCWSPDDAPRVRAALDRSDGHLRPFIPFMKDEPRTLEATVQWLRGHRAAFDLDQHFRYAMLEARDGTLLGEAMLLDRHGLGEREVGYWLDVEHVGHGFAAEAAAALTRVAIEVERIDRVELQCTVENAASAAIAAKLGFEHEATLRHRWTDCEGVGRDTMIWTLFADRYRGTAASRAQLRAFDCLGAQIL